MKTINVGLIGVGRIGNVHYQNMQRIKKIHLVAVCDLKVDGSWEKEKGLSADYYTTDYHKVLADPNIDAVLICTPTNLHPVMVTDAALAGKSIFCEKPVGFDLEEILKTFKVIKETGVRVQVGFNRRFDHNFDRIVDHRDDGSIGEPQILKITSRDPEPPSYEYVKVSGGIFMDMTIHDFDMARFITGNDVASVFVVGGAMIDPNIKQFDDIDTAIVTLKFKNGMIGVIDNSRQAKYGYDQRIELFGTNGMSKADNVLNSTTSLATEVGISKDTPMFFFLQRYIEAYKTELEDFFESVIKDTQTKCTYEDGIKAILIAQAAKESYKTNQSVDVTDFNELSQG